MTVNQAPTSPSGTRTMQHQPAAGPERAVPGLALRLGEGNRAMRRTILVAAFGLSLVFGSANVFAAPVNPIPGDQLPPGTHCILQPKQSGLLFCEGQDGRQWVCRADLSECIPSTWKPASIQGQVVPPSRGTKSPTTTGPNAR